MKSPTSCQGNISSSEVAGRRGGFGHGGQATRVSLSEGREQRGASLQGETGEGADASAEAEKEGDVEMEEA